MRNYMMELFDVIFSNVCNGYEKYPDRFKNDTDHEVLKKDFRKYVTGSLSVASIKATKDLKLVTCGTILGPMRVLIVYNPFIVMQSGACIAVNAGRYNETGIPLTIIFVDGLFYKLSKDSQKFIIFHELGHSVRGKKKFRKLSEEKSCDRFAKANLKSISAANALCEVKNVITSVRGNRILKKISLVEIEKRIAAVE